MYKGIIKIFDYGVFGKEYSLFLFEGNHVYPYCIKRFTSMRELNQYVDEMQFRFPIEIDNK